MDLAAIAKDVISIQKKTFNNFMDIMILFQDQAEMTSRRWANHIGFGERAKEIVEQWRTVANKGRDDSRKFLNESLDGMEDYFSGLKQRRPSGK
jgi:hypothetical protein